MDREKVIKDLEFCVNGHFKVELSLATKILALLKELEPVEPDIEGGGYNWYPVCGACHGVIGDMDSYCKHCGTPVLKKEIKIHHMRGGVEIEETE